MKSNITPAFCILALSGCSTPYYEQENAVQIFSLDIIEEMGNLGGQSVHITGSGFGTDPSVITVMFGNQNATVIYVEDQRIQVVTPVGPIHGGAVDVRVGTPKGQYSLQEAYSYIISETNRSSDHVAYLYLINDSLSCYGGIHNSEIGGCDGFAYTGITGIKGGAEGFYGTLPNIHISNMDSKGGLSSLRDISWKKWGFLSESWRASTTDERALDTERVDLGSVTVTNTALSGSIPYCADLVTLADFVYNQTDQVPDLDDGMEAYYSNVGISSNQLVPYGDDNGCFSDSHSYAVDELQLCMRTEYEQEDSFVYEVDWPIEPNFFRDESGSMTDLINVELFVEKAEFVDSTLAQKNKVEITLPPYAIFEDATGRGTTWAVQDIAGTCPQDDGDIYTPLTDNDIVLWEWEPVDWEALSPGNSVSSVTSYVKVEISFFNIGWFGGEGKPLKATISVPDKFNFDEDTGKSSLSLPSWVLYSFPTIRYDMGVSGELGSPFTLNYGFLIITMDRVTEYTLKAKMFTNVAGDPEEIEGDFVFAYSTGDMGFFNYANPLDSDDSCNDCLDNDGDGWIDEKDPDCVNGEAETELTTENTCNDGIDNDEDGLVDAADDNCEDGLSAESAECSDGVDNDEDGWIDAGDPDCVAGIFENGTNLGETCNDGVDNDDDGWIDADDPGCSTAQDLENDGFFDGDGDGVCDYECNDGVDNDGHGDIDSADYRCFTRGAKETESSEFIANCADGEDNDGDGYTDANDPDCERTVTQEDKFFYDVTIYPWAPDCYNGTDDDGDGMVDALDPDCVNPEDEADGFTSSESAE